MTDAWLAMGLSSRTGFAFPVRSVSQAGEVDRFLVVAGRDPFAHRVQRALRLGTRMHLCRRARRMRRDPVEAVHPSHFLD
jgi:hypothetical protein